MTVVETICITGYSTFEENLKEAPSIRIPCSTVQEPFQEPERCPLNMSSGLY